MSATNFTPIQLYRTNTASGTAPSAGNLNAGELAINYNDGGMILFAKNTTGNVIKLMNNPASLLYPTTDGTAGQFISTDGSGTLTFASANSGPLSENQQTISSNYTVTASKNASSVGPITINTGIYVLVGTDQKWLIFN